MIAFILIAAAMVAVALAWLLVPLLRHRAPPDIDRGASNVALLRDQLREIDSDVANVVVRSFKKRAIDIKTDIKILGHTPFTDGTGTTVHYSADDGKGAYAQNLEVDAVVVSIGRRPFADQLGLEGTAVKLTERGFVQVDEFCFTGEPGVFSTSIAYVVKSTGRYELKIADADGANEQAALASREPIISPAWSPAGSAVGTRTSWTPDCARRRTFSGNSTS